MCVCKVSALVIKTLYQLAAQMKAPMPVEMIYLERLRLFVQLLQVLMHPSLLPFFTVIALLEKNRGCLD